MKKHKAIVIGTSLSGKTTLIKYLRSKTNLMLSEIDEELTLLNNGEYPSDDDYKKNVLTPKVISKIISEDDIVFFTNTDYFSIDDLTNAKKNGVQIIQLKLSLEMLRERNRLRVQNEGYADLSQWFEGMLKYQDEIRSAGLVDFVIDANQPIEEVANDLLKVLR